MSAVFKNFSQISETISFFAVFPDFGHFCHLFLNFSRRIFRFASISFNFNPWRERTELFVPVLYCRKKGHNWFLYPFQPIVRIQRRVIRQWNGNYVDFQYLYELKKLVTLSEKWQKWPKQISNYDLEAV